MRLLPVLLFMLVAHSSHAASDRLSAEDIRDQIVGKTVFLAVPFGGEFPLNYRRDGRVDGTGEALGLGKFTRPRDSGTWWIDGDRLCQKFSTWYDGSQLCFELYRLDETRIRWIQDNGDKGTARIGPAL